MIRWLACNVALILAAAEARGHFLFVRVTPPAEAGRAAEVYFSERAEAGDPIFINKIAHTQLWLQATPGKFTPLQTHKRPDRLRAPMPGSESIAIIGKCEYGVLPRKTPFLLRHYPKAMAGVPSELNRMKPFDGVPLEIAAQVNGDSVRLTALRDGKPLADAVFIIITRDLVETKLKAGADGSTEWQPAERDDYSVYIQDVKKQAGTFKDTKYEEIRDFATLAFTWPLQPSRPDPKAVALFQEALAARSRWDKFTGFSAKVSGEVDGRRYAGSVSVDGDGEVIVDVKDETGRTWVQEQLDSIVLHRAARSDARSKGKEQPFLYFGDHDTSHPLGRLLIFRGGRFASSYRVKDRQIMVVNRHLGKESMTITALDNDRNAEGRFMPRSYTVQYWDAADGKLKRTETIHDRWVRIGPWDLSAAHTVTIAADGGLSVRSFVLTGHRLEGRKQP
ncbi:MAG: DUF3386 family protein [Planctomycetes bacterium]|nr:DUF3386 family protein [Planctomycetota bacterium]